MFDLIQSLMKLSLCLLRKENSMERELLHNSIQCPDGTILVSRHQHDFVEHKQDDGREYFLDGGLAYSRIGYSDNDYIDLCIYTDQPHEEIREGFEWGSSFDKDMNRLPATEYIKLKDITNDHLESIFKLLSNSDGGKIMDVILNEMQYRNLL